MRGSFLQDRPSDWGELRRQSSICPLTIPESLIRLGGAPQSSSRLKPCFLVFGKNFGKIMYMYKICVSGAEQTGHCASEAAEKAREIGRQIVAHKGMLLTGACWGMPYEAAKGVKEAGGFSVGVSPAMNEKDHLVNYRFPVDQHDQIYYTGFGFSSRNLWLMRMADAVIFICGRMGTLNEFTICFEDGRLAGVLEGTGGMADLIKEIVKVAHKGEGRIIYERDPKKLLDKICQAINREKQANSSIKVDQ